MIDGVRTRLGDERGFLHKKIFGGISRLAGVASGLGIPGAGIVSGITGRFAGGAPRRPPSPVIQTFPSTFGPVPSATTIPGIPLSSRAPRRFGSGRSGLLPVGGLPDCPPPLRRNDQGLCVSTRSPFGAQEFGGDVIAGQYGAGYIAGSRIVDVAKCPRGTVLGKDGVCYANLANKNRLYPRGRRPLLTGGDMRAISRARTAGNRLANAKSDLLAIGMLKAAGPRKRRKKTVPTC